MAKRSKKSVGLALNLKLIVNEGLKNRGTGIVREDIAPQDLSFMDAKLKEAKKRMKDHPYKNRDWDPETKTYMHAVTTPITLDPNVSRQVRRQVARMEKKVMRKGYHYQKVKVEDDQGNRTLRSQLIARPVLTLVNTSKYRAHSVAPSRI